MPRYYGEGPREMYWARDGKWYHSLSDCRSFKTYEEAKRDYDAHDFSCIGGGSITTAALIIAVILVVLVVNTFLSA